LDLAASEEEEEAEASMPYVFHFMDEIKCVLFNSAVTQSIRSSETSGDGGAPKSASA
jgi:hypothetical protein